MLIVIEFRQFECFLCNEMKQKMYREQFLSTSRYNFPSLLYGKSLEVTQIQHTEI